MNNLINIALLSKVETATIEFKESFEVTSGQDWCEIIKDIIALANTEGGIIVFGLDDSGRPVGMDIAPLLNIDPADITNKVNKYTGYQFSEFKMLSCEKSGYKLLVMVIKNVSIPIVFIKPGTYDIGGGKQKTAFGIGTVYFRHGAKSEPGNTDDLRRTFENRLHVEREELLKNMRQVIEAPQGTTFITIPLNQSIAVSQDESSQSVRIVDDPNAIPVNIKEEDILKITPYDYGSLTAALRERYTNFIANLNYHRIRKPLENISKYCRVRYLDPINQRGGSKRFYSAEIFDEFDKHYIRKQST